MATPDIDGYFDYIAMLKKCHGGDIETLSVADIKIAQHAVKTSPIADGFYKVGTMTIDRTVGAVKRELIELNRLIDELRR